MPERQQETATPHEVLDVATRLRTVAVPLYRALRQHTGGRLNATQGSVLGSILRHGPIRPTDLALKEQLSLPMASRAVKALEDEGLVQRTYSPIDGRASLLSVTPEGMEWLLGNRLKRDQFLAERLRLLPPDDLDQLARALPALETLITLIQ
jgi:DNA-binding MarR family transcriptional regulator